MAVAALVGNCPPLDRNSPYLYLLQCSDFADSCAVAETGATITGWVSGYRRPSEPSEFFLWQVAVARELRGRGLAQRMIEAILARPSGAGARYLLATITGPNAPSWALFEGLARRWNATIERSLRFDGQRHFGGRHESEWQVRIGPLPGL